MGKCFICGRETDLRRLDTICGKETSLSYEQCKQRDPKKYPDHKGREWELVRYGDVDEGILVQGVEDGMTWRGWIPIGDFIGYIEGRYPQVTVLWMYEV